MGYIKLWLSMLMMGLISTSIFAFEISSATPIGYWKTLDEATGKPSSIVQIWKTDNDVLMGKVVKIYSAKGQVRNNFCDKCVGNLRNHPVVGMVIISGLKSHPNNHWGNGRILDVNNGRTYNLSMRTFENGKKLDVRGYVGIPLLGRSQTWERVDLMSARS